MRARTEKVSIKIESDTSISKSICKKKKKHKKEVDRVWIYSWSFAGSKSDQNIIKNLCENWHQTKNGVLDQGWAGGVPRRTPRSPRAPGPPPGLPLHPPLSILAHLLVKSDRSESNQSKVRLRYGKGLEVRGWIRVRS